jgi:hypothetical protein
VDSSGVQASDGSGTQFPARGEQLGALEEEFPRLRLRESAGCVLGMKRIDSERWELVEYEFVLFYLLTFEFFLLLFGIFSDSLGMDDTENPYDGIHPWR